MPAQKQPVAVCQSFPQQHVDHGLIDLPRWVANRYFGIRWQIQCHHKCPWWAMDRPWLRGHSQRLVQTQRLSRKAPCLESISVSVPSRRQLGEMVLGICARRQNSSTICTNLRHSTLSQAHSCTAVLLVLCLSLK